MKIVWLKKVFSVCQVCDFSKVDFGQEFCFAAKTDEEYSLVCPADRVPANTVACDCGWRAFCIQGTLDFSLVGILAAIAAILAERHIPIFAISTYNTDYVLTKEENVAKATQALRVAGYEVFEQEI